MARNLYEILEQINAKNTPDTSIKAELWKHHEDYALKQLFKMVYDIDFVGFDLPEGTPPYKFDPLEPYGYAETNLTIQIRKLYVFMNDFHTIPRKRKEELFVQLLENLHFREAELILAVKERDITSLFGGINECLIREVFPDWLSPVTNSGYIDAAILAGFGKTDDVDNLVYSRYTIDEIKRASRRNTIVFFDYEEAKKAGIDSLSYDYIPVVDKEKNIEVILTKVIFGRESTIRTWIPIDNIAMSKKASDLKFVDIERAKELGVDHFEINKWQEKLQGEAARREIRLAKKNPDAVVPVAPKKKAGAIPDIVRPKRAPKPKVTEK